MTTWSCARCAEQHEESFDACWKCGGPRGAPALATGERLPSVEELTAPPNDGSLDEQFRSRFECERCGTRRPIIKRIAATGTGMSRLLNVQGHRFLTVSCTGCGRAELYDLDVIEGSDKTGMILDLIFGR